MLEMGAKLQLEVHVIGRIRQHEFPECRVFNLVGQP